ncbi:B12-binding domain-containing radical SAM protein [Vibrio misgurnus]|uniref:B12-binding domain-containing radical SAM protein n=1 Tax=Vibrio misgurnus TaxID=2993714 RepID=UPI0023F67043|nr:radical SAM protein [Vibrio sp. VCS]
MYEGKIYRPWTEADSQLIQVTLGCSNNQCTFCNMFSDKKFRCRKQVDIFQDIEQLRQQHQHVESIFLIDGNVMVLPTRFLLQVLKRIRIKFPEVRNIALYSCLKDICKKSLNELEELKAAGITMIYAGLESGDRTILEQIKKGMTPEQAIEGMSLAKQAGIRVLLSFIFGLGGRNYSQAHIQATTILLNQLQPDEIAPMALAVQPGTELEQNVITGRFVLPTPKQLLEEELYLLNNLNNFPTYYWGDHGNNLTTQRGWLPEMREQFIKRIEHALNNHPLIHQERLHTLSW